MSTTAANTYMTKPLAGVIFVLGWAIGITLWSIAHLAPTAAVGAFTVDVGILLVSIATAAPFLVTHAGLRAAIILGLIGIVLFAIGDLGGVPVITYTLRLLAPLLALLTPVYRLLDFKIFA